MKQCVLLPERGQYVGRSIRNVSEFENGSEGISGEIRRNICDCLPVRYKKGKEKKKGSGIRMSGRRKVMK